MTVTDAMIVRSSSCARERGTHNSPFGADGVGTMLPVFVAAARAAEAKR